MVSACLNRAMQAGRGLRVGHTWGQYRCLPRARILFKEGKGPRQPPPPPSDCIGSQGCLRNRGKNSYLAEEKKGISESELTSPFLILKTLWAQIYGVTVYFHLHKGDSSYHSSFFCVGSIGSCLRHLQFLHGNVPPPGRRRCWDIGRLLPGQRCFT